MFDIQILRGVDLRKEPNALILTVSLGAAMLPTAGTLVFDHTSLEARAALGGGITLGGTTTILLNLFFQTLTIARRSKTSMGPPRGRG